MNLREKRRERVFGNSPTVEATTTIETPQATEEQSAIQSAKSSMLSAIDRFVAMMKGNK